MAHPEDNLKNTFLDDPKRASEAAKKQKRGIGWKSIYEKIAQEIAPEKIQEQFRKLGYELGDKTMSRMKALRLFHKAIVEGDVRANNSIDDRMNGKPSQGLELSGEVKYIVEWPND